MSYQPIRTIREILESVLEALQPLKVLGAVRGTLADLRVSITGGSLSTITTVTTLANQTSAGGYLINPQIPAQMNTIVALGQTANISVAP